jgi:hypothetical protein
MPAPRLTARNDEPLTTYRPVSVPAVVGLLLALLSPAALLHPALWALPAAALIVGLAALRGIARGESQRIGVKAAVVGILVSSFVLSAAVVEWWTYRRLMVTEARQFGAEWFRFLASDQPQKAHALTIPPQYRPPLAHDDAVWEFYRTAPQWRRGLEGYVADPLVRTLLALGERAEVRYFKDGGIGDNGERQVAFPVFVVTYDDAGRTTSFFVMLTLERSALEEGRGDWQVARTQGGIVPTGF